MANESKMTLLEHLDELRSRIVKCLAVFLLCTGLTFAFGYLPIKQILVGPLDALDPNTSNPIARFNPIVNLLRPYLTQGRNEPGPVTLHALTVMEVFMVKFKISLLGGLILSVPVLFYQGWAFIGAGLLGRERRVLLTYLPFSLGLFVAGALFGYLVAVPIALIYLLGVDPEVELMLTYAAYFGTTTLMIAMFGLAFQLPLVTMALSRLGILPAQTLVRSRRYAIVIIFIMAAVITPSPEPFSQCLLAFPMIGLYELGLRLAVRSERRRKAAGAA
jgi:sec-independent protein translocase protein TatC